MKKKLVRLTESDLHNIIRETIENIMLDDPSKKAEIEADIDNDEWEWGQDMTKKGVENDYSWYLHDQQPENPDFESYVRYNIGPGKENIIKRNINNAIEKRNHDKDWSEEELEDRDITMYDYINNKEPFHVSESKLRGIIKQAINESFNKRSVINKLYKIVQPFTKGKYHDTGWQGVDDIINALQNAGYEVYVSVKDGGYRNSKGGNTMFAGSDVSYWKEFELEIPIEDKVINGRICCHAAGTVDDVFSSYDQTCTFW